ncbi:fkbp-type peptidyl-prolyl cis-trans isomerase ilpa [Luminiphilus syltensis NOR5-1B]|uniref:Peptidyl-prolyl cis-trans isomerase n=1 Tax=Luminiphilus syltensis NOR5-1B TaxID=565045 RepID=B8KQI0_9GAMM|nr:peptidylprolyl isomerase [Luminiphilus syltensis]EED35455.1 fkbp-type peptidyl-prolyl cis-trans isomerase ilpa [Luminiphilus syltensis NOR5-1B]
MQVGSNKVISLDYTLRNDAGDVIDQSAPDAPLSYLHGHNNLIPGLEAALEDKAQGDQVEAIIPPEEAYGAYNEQLIQDVPREMFQGIEHIEPGMQFQTQTAQGPQLVTVKEANDDSVKIDGNHVLAGETLHFDVTIKDVREASAEELEHGHVHGPGGHAH